MLDRGLVELLVMLLVEQKAGQKAAYLEERLESDLAESLE